MMVMQSLTVFDPKKVFTEVTEAVTTSFGDGGEHFKPIPISPVARFIGI